MLGPETVVNEDISDTGQLSKREQGRALLAPSDLMTIDETEVVILLPTGNPVICARFTYETFPAQISCSRTKFIPLGCTCKVLLQPALSSVSMFFSIRPIQNLMIKKLG